MRLHYNCSHVVTILSVALEILCSERTKEERREQEGIEEKEDTILRRKLQLKEIGGEGRGREEEQSKPHPCHCC